MTYDDSVARMTRSNFSPSASKQQMSQSTGFQQRPPHPTLQTQYQMMNSYQSKQGLQSSKASISQGGAAAATQYKDFTNTRFRFTESPHYSAHKTNEKFFKTIDESPLLVSPDKTSQLPPRPSRNSKRAGSQFPPGSPVKATAAEMRETAPALGSIA